MNHSNREIRVLEESSYWNWFMNSGLYYFAPLHTTTAAVRLSNFCFRLDFLPVDSIYYYHRDGRQNFYQPQRHRLPAFSVKKTHLPLCSTTFQLLSEK